MLSCFDTIHGCDRRKDRRMHKMAMTYVIALGCNASCGKNTHRTVNIIKKFYKMGSRVCKRNISRAHGYLYIRRKTSTDWCTVNIGIGLIIWLYFSARCGCFIFYNCYATILSLSRRNNHFVLCVFSYARMPLTLTHDLDTRPWPKYSEDVPV